MDFLKKNKILLLTVVLFGLLLWAYNLYFAPSIEIATDPGAQAVGSDVLQLHTSLQSVSLDQTLFSSPLYRNLVDFSSPLQNQPIGRPNPFGPIGQD